MKVTRVQFNFQCTLYFVTGGTVLSLTSLMLSSMMFIISTLASVALALTVGIWWTAARSTFNAIMPGDRRRLCKALPADTRPLYPAIKNH